MTTAVGAREYAVRKQYVNSLLGDIHSDFHTSTIDRKTTATSIVEAPHQVSHAVNSPTQHPPTEYLFLFRAHLI
jgi:hypothetical protein